MNNSLKYLLGLILSAALAMKGEIVIFIILSLITIIALIIVISMFSCMKLGYEMCRCVKNSFLVPYGHLIDYSIYWLKFLKEESEHTIQMLNESKHFKKLSKELDEKIKSNSLIKC